MIYPRRGSAFSLSLKITPWSLFKPEGFYKLSDAEQMAVRDDVANKYPGLTESQLMRILQRKWQTVKIQTNINLLSTINGLLILHGIPVSLATWFFQPGQNSVIPDIIMRKSATSPFEKFNVGGSGMMGYNLYGTDIVALRGYADGTLTPQATVQRNGSYVRIDDGNVYVKYTLEMRYPFSLNPSATIYGLAFLEGGNCWQKIDQFNPFMIKRSAGIGLRAFLPMFGMLGIDWGLWL